MPEPNARRGSEELVERLLPRLYRTAYYLTRDENEAEDAVQETIARLLQTRSTDPRRVREPAAWCAVVLARLCANRRREALPTGLDEDAAVDLREPEAAVIASEIREVVRRRVGELPPDEREALCLHVFAELTIRQVAAATGVSRSCAHERIQKAIERLRRRIEPAILGAIAPPGAPAARLIDALRAIPSPAPSAALTAAVSAAVAQALGTSSLLPATLSLGGIIMLKSKALLLATTAILLATTIGLGVKLAMVRRGSAPPPGSSGAGDSETTRLVAGLKQRIVELERRLPTAPAAAERLAPKDIQEMLAAAIDAFQRKEVAAFRDALLALLDAGPAAHAAVIGLLDVTGDFNTMAAALSPKDETFAQDLIHAIAERRGKLGALADAILKRDADPDRSTLFAFDLLRYCRVASGLAPGEQASAFLRILERSIEIEEDGVEWNHHAIMAGELLGRLRPAEALPRLQALLDRGDASETNQVAILRAVARIGGADAVGILTSVRDRSSPPLRYHLINNLAMYDYGNPEVDAFLRETIDLEEDPSHRSEYLRTLARRREERGRLAGRLDDPGLDRRERLTILEALFEDGNEEEREAAWRHVESSEAEIQDEVLPAFANREPRAMERLLAKLESGSISRELAGGFGHLDPRIVQRHRDRLARAAGNPELAVRIRAAAATALAKVDPASAAENLLRGFDGAPEESRMEIVNVLRNAVGGGEARAHLARIAAADPSEKVRLAAGG